MPECLKCGCELELDDCVDTEFYGNTAITHNLGSCPNCGTLYQWEKVYKFEKFQDLRIE